LFNKKTLHYPILPEIALLLHCRSPYRRVPNLFRHSVKFCFKV